MYSIVNIFQWIFEIFFGTVHILMMIFLIAKRKKIQAYNSLYYTIFCCISIIDILYVLNTDIGMILSKYPSVTFFLADTYYPTVFYFISAYTAAFEICGHTILSINRYYTIKNARINHICWSKQVNWICYILLFVCPMPTTIYRLFTPATYNYKEGIPFIIYVNPTISKIVPYANMSYYTINVTISLYTTICSYVNYRTLTRSHYQMRINEKRELKLIMHSILMFLLLIARYVYQITLLISTLTKSESVIAIAQVFFPIVASSYSLCGGTMLLLVSEQVRYDFLEYYGWKKTSIQDTIRTFDSSVY